MSSSYSSAITQSLAGWRGTYHLLDPDCSFLLVLIEDLSRINMDCILLMQDQSLITLSCQLNSYREFASLQPEP